MIRMSKQTKLTPQQVTDRAVKYFGPGGLELEVEDRGEGCAQFVGGGGFVNVTSCQGDGTTEVVIESREWEEPVKAFIAQL